MPRTAASTRGLVGGTFSPTVIPGLGLWLKADALSLNNDDLITTWTDSSGNGFDAAGSGATNPVYKTNIINGLPVVRLSGSNGFQLAANPSAAESTFDVSQYTIFAVALRTAGSCIISKNALIANSTRRKIQINLAATTFSLSAGADGVSVNQTATTSSFNIYTIIGRGNSDHDLVLNGTVNNKVTALNDDPFNNSRVEIGQAFSNGAERLTGDIAEIIVYTRTLNTSDWQGVNQYLSNKYAISVADFTPATRTGAAGRTSDSGRTLVG